MDILVVSFGERDTRYVSLSVNDKGMVVRGVERGPSLLDALTSANSENVASNVAFACKSMKSKASEILFLLPSALVTVDCFETNAVVGKDGWLGKLTKWVATQFAPGKESSIITRIAMLRQNGNGLFVSAAAISVNIAKTLEKVASTLKKQVLRIEPEIFGLIRCMESRKVFCVAACEENCYISAYAPQKGVLTLKIPTPYEDEWIKTIQHTIGFAAEKLFEINEAAFSYFSQNSSALRSIKANNQEIIPASALYPGNLEVKKCEINDEYLPLLCSALMQSNDEPDFASLPTVNFVREEIREINRKEKNEKKILFGLSILRAAAVLFIVANVAVLTYSYLTSSNNLSPKLQNDYAIAKQSLVAIDKREKIINESYKSDVGIIRIVDTVTALRPATVKIQRVEVTDSGGIKLEAHSSAPEVGNVYVQRLLQSEKQIIKKADLEKINSTTNGTVFMISAQAFR